MGKRRRYPIVIDDRCVGWVTATKPPTKEFAEAMQGLAIAVMKQMEDKSSVSTPKETQKDN